MLQDGERSQRHISWEEIDSTLDYVKDEVRERYRSLFDIPRGGLIVALLLSYKTGLRTFLDERAIEQDTLVVDDIVDQGPTLRHLFSRCTKFGPDEHCPDVLALYFRTREFAFAFPAQDAGDDWLVFPWEDAESSKRDRIFGVGEKIE